MTFTRLGKKGRKKSGAIVQPRRRKLRLQQVARPKASPKGKQSARSSSLIGLALPQLTRARYRENCENGRHIKPGRPGTPTFHLGSQNRVEANEQQCLQPPSHNQTTLLLGDSGSGRKRAPIAIMLDVGRSCSVAPEQGFKKTKTLDKSINIDMISYRWPSICMSNEPVAASYSDRRRRSRLQAGRRFRKTSESG